jgi:hypothetical protein
MIFLFGGLGLTPSALNINVDHVLLLKVVPTEYISFFVSNGIISSIFKRWFTYVYLEMVRPSHTYDLLIWWAGLDSTSFKQTFLIMYFS